MKQRTIFFLYYRAGSTLFECLCGKPWRIAQVEGRLKEAGQIHSAWRQSGDPFYLDTIPPCVSEDVSIPFIDAYNRYKDRNQFIYMLHVGDWWGQKRSKDIPEPFEDPTSQKWGPDELIVLPEFNTWQFIYLVRDGRCQIESLRNLKGGIEEKLNQQDPEDYFKVLCMGFRNRARLVVESKKHWPNKVHIFHYIDFIRDPINIVEQMFRAGGLILDREKITIPSTGDIHSSFGKVRMIDNRYINWTEEEKDVFNKIAGQENKELGYQ